MVGSLSGAMEEVYLAKETIRKWNQQNAERTGKVFMPIEWGSTQEAIQNTDIVIGIIGNWIENSKFVEDCVEADKQVMLFFDTYHDANNAILSEVQAVEIFKKNMASLCKCFDYGGFDVFSDTVQMCLDTF